MDISFENLKSKINGNIPKKNITGDNIETFENLKSKINGNITSWLSWGLCARLLKTSKVKLIETLEECRLDKAQSSFETEELNVKNVQLFWLEAYPTTHKFG